MYFATIHYTEGEGQDSYGGIELRKPDDQSILWHTDDFVQDYSNFMVYLKENATDDIVMGSSTMDSFFYEEPQRYECSEEVLDFG